MVVLAEIILVLMVFVISITVVIEILIVLGVFISLVWASPPSLFAALQKCGASYDGRETLMYVIVG